jgi:hypothetical protein
MYGCTGVFFLFIKKKITYLLVVQMVLLCGQFGSAQALLRLPRLGRKYSVDEKAKKNLPLRAKKL